jgi:hypothetical protein
LNRWTGAKAANHQWSFSNHDFHPGNDNGAPNLGNGDTGPTEPRRWDAYEFGAPESVLDRSQIFDLFAVGGQMV